MPCVTSVATTASAVVICPGISVRSARFPDENVQIAAGLSRVTRILDKAGGPCTFRTPAPRPDLPTSKGAVHAPLPHPHLRLAPRERHRQRCAAVGVVPPHP